MKEQKEIIEFDEWMKFDLRIGEVKKIDDDFILINLGDKDFSYKGVLKVKKGEKLVVGIDGGKLVIPVVNGGIPIGLDDDIEVGSRVS